MLKYLLEKEFKQFFRNAFLPKLIILFPLAIMLIVPWIASMDVKNIKVAVVNHDSSSAAESLLRTIESSSYFVLEDVTADYGEALSLLEFGGVDAIVEIPAAFEKSLLTEGTVPVQISVNAVNEIKGSLGSSYLMAICSEFSADWASEMGMGDLAPAVPKLNVNIQHRYNPYMDYKLFMIPAMMVMIIILMGGFLPAMSIVGEKEKGTIEQLNISPLPKFDFILAKLIPYWIIGLLTLSLSILVTYLAYGLWPGRGIWTIYLFSVMFILSMSGFGLVVSNYSSTMQQATFITFFFVLIFMLISGMMTPLRAMPDWAQYIALVNPPRYYIEMMRVVYLKGGTLVDLWPQFIATSAFSLFFSIWAVLSYRKRK